jgi:hypothetical protein
MMLSAVAGAILIFGRKKIIDLSGDNPFLSSDFQPLRVQKISPKSCVPGTGIALFMGCCLGRDPYRRNRASIRSATFIGLDISRFRSCVWRHPPEGCRRLVGLCPITRAGPPVAGGPICLHRTSCRSVPCVSATWVHSPLYFTGLTPLPVQGPSVANATDGRFANPADFIVARCGGIP